MWLRTGGFLTATLAHVLRQFRDEQGNDDSTEEFNEVTQRLGDYAQKHVFGADFDPFLIKASQMNMVMSGDGRGHLYNMNSLEFPEGYLDDVKRAAQECALDTIDVLITNPPFGSRSIVYRALCPVAQTWWAHGNCVAQRHPRQPGGGVHSCLDSPLHMGAGKHRSAGRGFYR